MRRSTAGTSTARCSKQAGENTSPGAPGRCPGAPGVACTLRWLFPGAATNSGITGGITGGTTGGRGAANHTPSTVQQHQTTLCASAASVAFCASTQAVAVRAFAVQAFAVQGIGHPGVCHVGVCHVGVCHVGVCHVGVGCCSTFLTTEYVGQHQPPWGQLGVRTCSIVFILNVEAQEQSRFTLCSGNAAALCDI